MYNNAALNQSKDYWIYNNLLTNNVVYINTKDITKENWNMHYDNILKFIKDYIETDYLKFPNIVVTFPNKKTVTLGLVDYWYNVIMWYLIIIPELENFGRDIEANDLFFPENGLTVGFIKNYIDFKFIEPCRSKIHNKVMNHIIDECLSKFIVIDEFGFFLMNTIDLERVIIEPMLKSKEVYDMIHINLDDVPIDDVKKVADEATAKFLKSVDKDNPLYDYIKSGEGIKKTQLRESFICIAQKPDGQGGVYPVKIKTSLISGGANNPLYYMIESSTGRTAQLILKNNVGISGYLARKLGLNSMDTSLHPDPEYSCDTVNFVPLTIVNEKELKRYHGRYYRYETFGTEYRIHMNDKFLIGKKILLRSPMTCASKDRGGVCYKCYGDLAYNNRDINIGKYAAESTSSGLTQRMISAKHFLEPNLIPFKWVDDFYQFFELDIQYVMLKDLPSYNNLYIRIDKSMMENFINDLDEPPTLSNFEVVEKVGDVVKKTYNILDVSGTEFSPTENLVNVIDSLGDVISDDEIFVPFNLLQDIPLFTVSLVNRELSESLDKFQNCIDKKSVTPNFNIETILRTLNDTLLEIGITDVSSVHIEVILSNQIRKIDNELETPDWSNMDEPYQILTLKSALVMNPSITKSLSFEDLRQQIEKPITYRKTKASIMDLFFMSHPQNYLSDELVDRREELPNYIFDLYD